MTQASPGRRPKLVFFQWDHRPNARAAGYLLLHMQQHVKCLATHFDVVVIDEDCDYDAVCQRHEPDLALFEAGYRSHGSRRIAVANTHRHPGVPKLGLHNADPWCDRRAGFLSDMDRWGIETFFTISTLMPVYTPEIAASTFIWPNFIDPDLFHDYGQEKVIPVTLTGQAYGLYPWRQRVFPLLRDRYPCLVSPALAYESRAAARLLAGESYARALNASFVVPTCGTAGGEVVRKHFEIPAAMALMVTERTPGLEAAGFVDMVNCVFADRADIADKLDHLFSDREAMRRITEAGHALVHGRHTLRHRPQIHQWFRLQRGLAADERIIQQGPFGDLVRVPRAAGGASAHVAAAGADRALLAKGAFYLRHGRIEDAREAYAECLGIVSYMPEAKFGLAHAALLAGDAAEAVTLLGALVEVTTGAYGAADPDPVDWAHYLLALVCAGRLDTATGLSQLYPRLCHPELARVRQAIDRLAGRPSALAPAGLRQRPSIHPLPERSDAAWRAWFADLLERCGQAGAAAELAGPPDPRAPRRRRKRTGRMPERLRIGFGAGIDRLLVMLRLGRLKPSVPPAPGFRYYHRLARNFARAVIAGRRLRRPRPALPDLRSRIRPPGRDRRAGREPGSARARPLPRPVPLDTGP